MRKLLLTILLLLVSLSLTRIAFAESNGSAEQITSATLGNSSEKTEITIPADFSKALTFDKGDYHLSLTPLPPATSNPLPAAKAEVSDNTLIYPEGLSLSNAKDETLQKVDVILQALNYGLKESIVIKSNPSSSLRATEGSAAISEITSSPSVSLGIPRNDAGLKFSWKLQMSDNLEIRRKGNVIGFFSTVIANDSEAISGIASSSLQDLRPTTPRNNKNNKEDQITSKGWTKEKIFEIPAPYAIDSKGKRTDDIKIEVKNSSVTARETKQSQEITSSPASPDPRNDKTNEYTLTMSVDSEYFKTASFPVVIDPTLLYDNQADFNNGSFNREAQYPPSPLQGIFDNELSVDANTLALWHLNESADNSCSGGEDACDSTSTGHHGTASGTTITTEDQLGSGRARRFDGTDDNIEVSDHADWTISTNAKTIEAWVKLNTIGGSDQAIVSQSDAEYYWEFRFNGTNGLGFGGNYGGIQNFDQGSTAGWDTNWHHVAFVTDGTTFYLYMDGAQIKSGARTADFTDLTGPLAIGSQHYTGGVNRYFFPGVIEEVRISNTARTASEIASDALRVPSIESYYRELPADINTAGLWHLNETLNDSCSGGQDVCDSSGNNSHGTATGTTIDTANQRLGAATRTFNGTSDYVSIPDFNDTGNAGQSISVFLWIKDNTITNNSSIISHWNSSDNQREWDIEEGASNNIRVVVSNLNITAYKQYESSISINDGKWHHVGFTFDAGVLRLYVDGMEDTAVTKTVDNTLTSLGNSTANVLLGAIQPSSPTYFYSGSIDEIRISSIVRTPEEIKADAQRAPYSVYTSPSIDLGTPRVTSLDSLLWTQWGVRTGDGETASNGASLVAQWNFNETSGTTAASGGSCASNCNGTVTSMTTSGQDAAAGDGWTVNNKRWGAGALMFDGTDGHVTVPDTDSLSFGNGTTDTAFSIESWVKMQDATRFRIFMKGSDGAREYALGTDSSDGLFFELFDNDGNNGIYQQSTSSITSYENTWLHIVGIYDGSSSTNGIKLYLNGTLLPTSAGTAGSYTAMHNQAQGALIGKWFDSGSYAKGVMDSMRIYSRVLTASEILSNYNAGNVEIQTRTSSDNSTWEEWKPVANETQIDSMDGPYQYNTNDSGLVSYWPMDENANGTCTSGKDACDKVSTNHGTRSGTTIVDGKFGKARSFNGSSDKITIPNNASITFGNGGTDSPYTLEGWVKMTSATSFPLFVKAGPTGEIYEYIFGTNDSDQLRLIMYNVDASQYIRQTSNSTLTAYVGQWIHIAATYDGSKTNAGIKLYLNGTLIASTGEGGPYSGMSSGSDLYIGGTTDWGFSNGVIDETRISSTVLSATTIYQHAIEGIDRLGAISGGINATTSGTLKYEGAGSEKITTGAPIVDGKTLGLWHLDETTNNATDIKDSTSLVNNSDAVSGTTSVNGFYGRAKSFNGSSDYIQISNESNFDVTTNVTVSVWFKPQTATAGTKNLVVKSSDSSTNGFQLEVDGFTTGQVEFGAMGGGYLFKGSAYIPNTWNHVVGVWDSALSGNARVALYINGIAVAGTVNSGGSITNITTSDYPLMFGSNSAHNNGYYNGTLDEVVISNSSWTVDQVAQAYRAGRDHKISKTISSTDLSGKTKLPFYVASDRQGQFMEATVGESAFANYEPDVNTLGFWHMEEAAGTSAYIKDSSSYGLDATPTNTAITQGKLGKARYFDGSGDFVKINSSSNWAFAGDFTVDVWVYPTGTGGSSDNIIGDYYIGGASTPPDWQLIYNDTNKAVNFWRGSSIATTANNTVPSNAWSHLALVRSGTAVTIYVNGQTSATGTLAGTVGRGLNLWIGIDGNESAEPFLGNIDEVRISNASRTADQIRQAYEVGKRTHPIIIDFKANLSGDFIMSTSDKVFSIDETAFGSSLKASHLFSGDKIIVKENIDGTEYIAQGTVASVNSTTGAVTVSSWDSGSTVPNPQGFDANATVFKWQREYFDLTGSLTSQRDAVTRLTFRVTDGSQGANIWLDDIKSNSSYLATPGGSTISSTPNRYFQYRMISSSNDSAVSSSITDVTLNYTSSNNPNVPTLDSPSDAATSQPLIVTFKTTATDNQSDYLRYKIEIATSSAFTQGYQVFDQTDSNRGGQKGWSGQDTQSSTAYASGTQTTYKNLIWLLPNTTYYWRSYAIDFGGSNTWSDTQTTPYSFTTSAVPAIPTLVSPLNSATAVSLTPALETYSTDSNSDYLRYKIQIATNSTFTQNLQTFDQSKGLTDTGWSGQDSQGGTAYVSGTHAIYTLQTSLQANTVYYWRSYAIDFGGSNTWSSTSSTYSFTTKAESGVPTLDSPANGATGVGLTPNLQTTATHPDGLSLKYKIQLASDPNFTSGLQTFDLTQSQTGWSAASYASGVQATYTIQSALLPNKKYFWRSYAIDPDGLNTWTGTQTPPNSFTTDYLSATSCLINDGNKPSDAVIKWVDNASSESRFRIERSVDNGAFSLLINTSANTTSYTDNTTASGHTYKYRIRAEMADNTTTMWCVTPQVDYSTGNFQFQGLQMQGLQIK